MYVLEVRPKTRCMLWYISGKEMVGVKLGEYEVHLSSIRCGTVVR